jgi:hypothetical protein
MIELWTIQIESGRVKDETSVPPESQIFLGCQALNSPYNALHRIDVKSHDMIVQNCLETSGRHGIVWTKTRGYINENPPWSLTELGDLLIVVWKPTIYGEDGPRSEVAVFDPRQLLFETDFLR